MLFGNSNRKCCIIEVKNKNNEVLARLSPIQLRLPANQELPNMINVKNKSNCKQKNRIDNVFYLLQYAMITRRMNIFIKKLTETKGDHIFRFPKIALLIQVSFRQKLGWIRPCFFI